MTNHVSICIPTYKRPEMLAKLIRSITDCYIDPLLIAKVFIIIVDNDKDKTAEEVVNIFADLYHPSFNIQYYHYPIKGLASVRNELLIKSLALNPEFIVFIDDDEYVTKNWLNELILTVISNKVDAARGPVIAAPASPVSSGILWLLKRENYPDNTRIKTWTAGNLIIRTTSLKKFEIQFDKRFNSIGSEDSYFGIQMEKKGASIFWAANAKVYETIPESRATVRWFLRRYYRVAVTFVYMLKLEKKYFQVFKKVLISFLYVLIGFISSILLLLPVKIKYWGLLKISEGIGGLAGLFNIQYKEYK